MLNALEDIKIFIQQNVNVSNSLMRSGDDFVILRNLQHFFAKKFNETASILIYQLILDSAAKAEAKCPTAGIKFIKRFASSQVIKSDHRRNDIQSRKSIENMLTNELGLSKFCCAIVMEAIGMASLGSKISIKKSAVNRTFVESTNGYSFDTKRLLPQNLRLEKPKVICIDGFIESVSEIHHLLEHFAESKNTGLLFVRGMSDDVLHTMKVNIDRGTLQLYPVVVPFDADSINTLVDIAVVAGGDVISHLKGNLISSIGVNDIRQVDYAVINASHTVIRNISSQDRVSSHRKFLLKQLEERPEIDSLLRNRIKSLTSSYVEVSIAADMNFLSNSQQIDEGIRYVMSLINSKLNPDEVAEQYHESFNKSVKNLAIDQEGIYTSYLDTIITQ